MEIQSWCKKIEQEVRAKNKRVVLVAGASSSGKSYSSQALCEYLNKHNIKAKLYSADNYYKGVSKIIVQKALQKSEKYSVFNKKTDEIVDIIKNFTGNLPSQEKFTKENKQKIIKYFVQQFGELGNALANDIIFEFENINFDEPFAIDFKKLSTDIQTILTGKGKIISPTYSFTTGESVFDFPEIIVLNCLI